LYKECYINRSDDLSSTVINEVSATMLRVLEGNNRFGIVFVLTEVYFSNEHVTLA
jgi:hypothetical protein